MLSNICCSNWERGGGGKVYGLVNRFTNDNSQENNGIKRENMKDRGEL